jgi:hypothetical protein
MKNDLATDLTREEDFQRQLVNDRNFLTLLTTNPDITV